MSKNAKYGNIQFNSLAICRTNAVEDFGSLLKQHHRWFLGFITNEACMLSNGRFWRCFSLLCILQLYQDTIQATSLLSLISKLKRLEDSFQQI